MNVAYMPNGQVILFLGTTNNLQLQTAKSVAEEHHSPALSRTLQTELCNNWSQHAVIVHYTGVTHCLSTPIAKMLTT